MEWRREERAVGGTYIRPLKYKCPLSNVQSWMVERGNRGDPSVRLARVQRTRGSEEEEDLMRSIRARSSA